MPLNTLKKALDPATRKLLMFGLVGLAIAGALAAGLQVRPPSLLPSTGILQVAIGDPSTSSSALGCDVTSLNVTVDSILVHRAGGLNLTGEWIEVLDGTKTFDLLHLDNVIQLLGSSRINEGTITQIRMHVSSAAAIRSGVVIDVDVSSNQLKINADGVTVKSGLTTSVTIHIDPHLVCQGNDKVRITPMLGKLDVTGPA